MSSPVDRRDWGGTLWERETETHQLGGSAVENCHTKVRITHNGYIRFSKKLHTYHNNIISLESLADV